MPEWMLWGYAFALLLLGVVCAVDERKKFVRRRAVSPRMTVTDPKDDSRD